MQRQRYGSEKECAAVHLTVPGKQAPAICIYSPHTRDDTWPVGCSESVLTLLLVVGFIAEYQLMTPVLVRMNEHGFEWQTQQQLHDSTEMIISDL